MIKVVFILHHLLLNFYEASTQMSVQCVCCEAQGKGRAKGGPRKVTQRSFMDGGSPFPDALH